MILTKKQLNERLMPIQNKLAEAQDRVLALEATVDGLLDELTRRTASQNKKLVAIEKRLRQIEQDLAELKEATKPTISKMTTAADEQTAVFNEVIDEWLNGKKEDDDE